MKLAASAVKRLLIPGGVFIIGLVIVALYIWSDDTRNNPGQNIPDGNSSSPLSGSPTVSGPDSPLDVADGSGRISSVNVYRDSSHHKTKALANKSISESKTGLN